MMKKNRLAKEKSPYLLQHAENPVDWFPWTESAFQKAKDEDKPIFLSIGYSTCHWCHVMEKESFEDQEIAKLMNDTFISIKVDREERPDIDGIYMTVCQMLTGGGGWPLTIVMTPDKKPFFAGTYFPKETRFGRSGLIEIIPQIKKIWQTRRDEINNSAEEITNAVNLNISIDEEDLTKEIFDKAYEELKNKFDEKNGGFGNAPKFPMPHNLLFLLRYWKRKNEPRALEIVEKTLTEMRKGGIYDHIGFGFSRYSTDKYWFVPHFEKMLYDQAQLAIAYTEAYQITKKEIYKTTALEILKYVMRDITSPEGGFYSAEDADSEGEEGKFYLWTEEEIRSLLKDDAEIILKYFNVKIEGNWSDHNFGGTQSTNILHINKSTAELAVEFSKDEKEIINIINSAKEKLFNVREKRIHPYKDDKILTDWNGLMISAFSIAFQVFQDDKLITTAVNAAEFVINKMISKNGRLLHRFRENEAGIQANVDDYAFFIQGLLDLYEASFEVKYLEKAFSLNEDLIKYFWNDKTGGFYFTPFDGEKLLIRQMEIYDGAVPSGNSIALLNLLRIGRYSGNNEYGNKAERLIRIFSASVKRNAFAFTQFLVGLEFAFGKTKEILIAGKKDSNKTKKIINAVNEFYIPNKIIILNDDAGNLKRLVPFISNYKINEGDVYVYICENYVCNLPVDSLNDLKKMLE